MRTAAEWAYRIAVEQVTSDDENHPELEKTRQKFSRGLMPYIAQIQTEAYRKGQEDMRERLVKWQMMP